MVSYRKSWFFSVKKLKNGGSKWGNTPEFERKNGGERGIRTPGGLPLVGFQDRCLKPLDHLSAQDAFRIFMGTIREGKIKYSKKGKNQG